ncbi:MAG: recombinase family protein [Lentisphaeria bacterium]|nr:MAG: recombinase family protein [Lentisphaeria bacterium]
MKALIYARQSSGKDDFSESVEAQIANCKKLAEKEKLEVIGIYKDLNTSGGDLSGRSGGNCPA